MDLSKKFEDYLHTLKWKNEPEGLYEAISYILQLGGKRIRPQLVLLGNEIFNGDENAVMPAAAAIELFHNFSLIHDDIMDNAPLRRGKKTVHEKFDTNTAILSGDAALIFCYEELLKLPADKVSAAIKLFNKTSLEVCEGQQFDMLFEKKSTVSVDDYLEMIRLKTAVLLGCALQLGAMMADANKNEQHFIYEFGMQMGVAFQLQDDILDTFGNPETFGKQVGGDIIQNKKTFLLLKAFELANIEQQRVLDDWLNRKEFDNAKKVEAVKNIFNQINVREMAETEMQKHFQKAIEAVHQLAIADEKKNQLIAFADALMKREK